MKPGRPRNRIRAYWVTFTHDHEEAFFQLDSKGRLITHGIPHHINKLVPVKEEKDIQRRNPLPIPIIQYFEEFQPYEEVIDIYNTTFI